MILKNRCLACFRKSLRQFSKPQFVNPVWIVEYMLENLENE
ncbi:hypothetical protein C943_01352 [Mariniradius saccharolyticus AK6]|uniref:Uncharacterized protein n=1 Tax=Mariniradius saccharolyticus AK6 TaxID=1239962 RepID=M7X3M2_9BACT|nr:hypothetical protein C943_01352 [Mariniradius saccharolyticus AK6]